MKNISKIIGHSPKPLEFFWQVVKPHRKWLFGAVSIVILASALSASTSYFFKLIVDAVEVGDLKAAMRYGLMYPVTVFVVQVLYRASGTTAAYLVVRLAKTTTDTLHTYLLYHNHTYFSDRFAGSIVNKVKNVVSAMDQVLPDFLWSQLTALVSFVVTFVLIWSVDWQAALIFAALLVVLGVVNHQLAETKAYLSKVNAEAGSALQGRAVDVVGNVSAVRQYVRQAHELKELEVLTLAKQKTGIATWMYTERLLLTNSAIIFVFIFLLFWLLVTRWGQGAITTGDFVLVIALVSQITGTLIFIGRAINATARAIGEMREGLEDIYVPYSIVDRNQATPLSVTAGKIVWENVTFRFGEAVVFADFSMVIEGEQRLGLVGPSGAGKSTFVSLLLRQHDLPKGTIKIDGQAIDSVTQDSLRQAIAVVPQEPILFHRSIKENIAYGNLAATLEDIERVAKLAYAHEFIIKLPQGYETTVGERGVKLSGGQKQRIAIARAMLKNAPILILDEATSALDSESEQLIQRALHTLMSGKTVIAIAHRLSTLREMDRIVVLAEGGVVEDGTHETLKEGGGTYGRLWSHQVGGYLHE